MTRSTKVCPVCEGNSTNLTYAPCVTCNNTGKVFPHLAIELIDKTVIYSPLSESERLDESLTLYASISGRVDAHGLLSVEGFTLFYDYVKILHIQRKRMPMKEYVIGVRNVVCITTEDMGS
jgi:hypothetical protein